MDHHPLLLANKSGFIFLTRIFLNTLPSEPTEAARSPPPGWGSTTPLLCSAWGFPDPCPGGHPHPSRQKGKPGERGAERRKARAVWVAAGEDCGEVARARRVRRAAPARRRKPCTCSNPGVSSTSDKSALRPPHPFPPPSKLQ